MNVNTELVKFASQDLILARSSSERAKIDASLNSLETKLNYGMPYEISYFLRFGSYTRNTILPRKYDSKSDVDLMVVFKASNGQTKTPNTYRKSIHDVLQRSYPNSFSNKDVPSVKLQLNHIMFDVVPAYIQQSLWSPNPKYYIPNKANGWMETFPNDINSKLSERNQAHGNNTVRNVIRLCKHWNSSAGYPFESYLMEKQIIDYTYWISGNTFEMFVKTMRHIAGNRPGVKQALDNIDAHKGNWFQEPNVDKQIQWLCKLLPGL